MNDGSIRYINKIPPFKGEAPMRKEELFICRKIAFGKNGNFVRYEPVKFPDGIDIINVQTRSRFYPFVEKIFKIRGKRG